MATRVINERTDYPKGAYVGPYWFVRDGSQQILLIAHRCALAAAEEYGDCLTCPHGHYDLWESWRTGAAPTGMTAIVRDSEYEEWLRERVVFNFVRRRFIVHGDRQIFEHKLQTRVTDHFGIPASSNVEFMKTGTIRARGLCDGHRRAVGISGVLRGLSASGERRPGGLRHGGGGRERLIGFVGKFVGERGAQGGRKQSAVPNECVVPRVTSST